MPISRNRTPRETRSKIRRTISSASRSGVARIARDFEAEYERLFGVGSALKDAGIELIDYGVDAIGIVHKPPASKHDSGSAAAPRIVRKAYCPAVGGMIDTAIYDGAALKAGATVTGPAVIEHPGTTIVLHTGHRARVDEFGNTRIASGQ